MIKLTAAEARKLSLVSQGLCLNPVFAKSSQKHKVASILECLSYVQIDTISVVERAHHHVLWSRNVDYQAKHLYQAVAAGQIFEYWSHAAAYLPMRDYRFSLPKKHAIAAGEKHWYTKDETQAKFVYDMIRERGPMQAKDFQQDRSIKNKGWGDRKPAKEALEILFMEGKLMIRERRGFQKVFDLTERVLPAGVDTTVPNRSEFLQYLIQQFLQAQGLGTAAQIGYLRKGLKVELEDRLRSMCNEGELTEVKVGEAQYYALSDFEQRLNRKLDRSKIRILSPFDNLLIQRERTRELFDFDYLIECYVPEKKRKYGYFVLPLLQGDHFIGRADMKVDRKRKVLEIKSLHWENKDYAEKFIHQIESFCRFNGVLEVVKSF